MTHDLVRSVSVGEDVKEIGLGDEIESGECTSLSLHELVKSFLAKSKLSLNIFKSLKDVFLIAELDSYLHLLTILKNDLDFLVNTNELLGLLGKFLLHLLGTNKQVLKERPKSLHLSNDGNDFSDSSQ